MVHSFADDVNRRGGGREFGFGWLVDANRTGESVSQSLYLGDFSRGRIWCRIIDHHWLQRGGSLVIRHPIIGFTDGITGLPAHLLSGPTAGDDTANSGVERHCGAVLLPVVAITHVISASPEAMQQIVFWLFGSLLKANMQGVLMTGSVLACSLVICLQQAWRLTALSAGEEQALGLGINVSALRKLAFLLATLLTAASVSFVGTIGFIGLVAPHFARMLVGEDQRYLIGISALCGSLLLVLASIISKLILPNGVVPIGIIIALIGVPVLFYFVTKQVKRA
ncbi:Iron(III) dicitrate transport system permease protein FecD [Yersinia pestis biovar Orientalis str. India 195]|uniref:FecCD transport family protein n=1 Tax=Yersinia pestis TaxID=632 RepID=Q8D034_YERPE|nr:putative inner membrane permease of iron ABC transporter [Yersinia pestis KIM10+]AAS61495.1 FecCD transport family protein [Yersinia pestis biovar Microtus str. 91001]EEO75090.1 Iron(III) dicitrate transport system permease protein FecD [Yersinia pestis Nepal516]EEO81816.1 Iron(III) dicitrate transport system permease protein FecD [Yersinia pestis biovar Orientalis str. India 195]EEO87718.1 Iron(III) dicitrate transport system permease protein FecD [Yersinia pestis biovar Orientalis str. PEX